MITKLQPTFRQRVMDYIMTEFFHFWMNVTFKKAELCDVANCFNVYTSCPKQKFKFWLWISQILLWTFLNHCVRFMYRAHCDFQVPTKHKLLKSVCSETYRVTQRVCPVPRQPAWSWLESVTYGCIVWHASLQAVLRNPATGLQCFQMWPAWISAAAHVQVNMERRTHSSIAPSQRFVAFCWCGAIMKWHVRLVHDVSVCVCV